VLGPILFTIFINDIDLAIMETETKIFKYADDSKFGRPVRSDSDSLALQSAIDNVCRWAERWGMEIHPQKTHVLHFGYGNAEYEYKLNGEKIFSVQSARDLGVLIHNSFKPSEHITAIAKKANGVLSQVNQTLVCRNQEVICQTLQNVCSPDH